jgi:CheY-like chemotaxis protein
MSLSAQSQPFIVYVDDDQDDLLLIQETLKGIDPSINVHGYTNGRRAFEFLESISEGELLPGLVILDLNMPEWNGMQTLDALKENSAYQNIPVLIFTNSDHPRHRELSLSKGAVAFLTKPYRMEELVKICSQFADYMYHPAQRKTG